MAERTDRFTETEAFDGYEVYDRDGDKIGKVDDLFLDETDQPEYVGVQMGLFGLSGTTLVPWEICRTDEANGRIEVEAEKERVKDAPNFDDDQQITPDFERQVHEYYGLENAEGFEDRGAYGTYYSDDREPGEDTERDEAGDETGIAGPGMRMGDTDTGEFREHPPEEEGANEPDSDLEDEDELRVQRTEEELRTGTREREAGKVNVRKRVRTDREEVTVPKRREEVSVERVPVDATEGERTAAEAEIGEDEIRVPVVEDEVVTEKKPVVKEEVRVRKDVVQDEEVIEEDVRKEEVEVDDETGR